MAAKNWRQESTANENAMTIRKALQRGPLRKIEVSRVTGLSRPTVDKHLLALQQSKEVYRKDRAFHLSKTGLAALKKLELLTKLSQLKGPVDITLLERQKIIPEIKVSSDRVGSRFLKDVESLSGQKILSCYVCGKCSAGCPISSLMDIQPHQIVRLIQLGQEEEVLNSRTIWLCSSCFTCASRCPRGISLTAIMEALRALVLRKGIDHISPSKIPQDLLAEAPQLALVSCLRKLSS
jgi:heterodisulfide reductase subunit C